MKHSPFLQEQKSKNIALIDSSESTMGKIHFLHIPKTGGTAFKNAIIDKKYIVLNGHGVTFQDIVETPSTQCIFFVRDIVPRFISGFNSRLRMGRPYTNAKWDEGEMVAFKRFKTPNELAEALSSPTIEIRRSAECAMANIWHTRFPLHFWLHSVEYLEQHKAKILFICRQDRLTSDFQYLAKLLGLSAENRLPLDEKTSHKTPKGFNTDISEKGKSNIIRWYQEDIAILDWCYKQREILLTSLCL